MSIVAPSDLDAKAEARGYRLITRLSSMEMPAEGSVPRVKDADSLLAAYVNGCDAHGRYFCRPGLVRTLFWWQTRLPSLARIEKWLAELEERGDLVAKPLGRSCFTGGVVPVYVLTNKTRFARFRARNAIPPDVRESVFLRDGHQCLHCGSSERLTLDHIHPWSKGGDDTIDNLQTLCGPCNSRKGARV